MTDTLTRSTTDTATRSGDQLDHYFCCDPSTALCGTDISGHVELFDDGEATCTVCADLAYTPCNCN